MDSSQNRKAESASIGAPSTGTTGLNVSKGERFTLSVSGFGTATIAFQRQLDGTNWRTVESYTADTEKDGIAAEDMTIRLFATAWASGTIVARCGR